MVEERVARVLKGHRTGNFLAYVRECMDTFGQRPLCAVDSLVFSWLAYMRLPEPCAGACTERGIALHELLRAEDFGGMFGSSWDPDGSRDLLFAVCASPRFRDCRLTEFRFKTDCESEEQFAAMTFRLPDGSSYVAFRGTDSTVVGWKEDFNMTYLSPVPAQEEAAAYLDDVGRRIDGRLYVGGHSKGGNLAVYAAALCAPELRRRIELVFSHDGPGFHREFCASPAYRRVMPIMVKTVPKSTLIGAVLSESPDFAPTIVESDGFSMLQHNPFLWEIDLEACAFVEAEGFTASSRHFDATLDAWMDKYSLSERARFVDALFDVIEVTGAYYFSDILADTKANLLLMREQIEGLDPEMQQFVWDVVKSFVRTATVERAGEAASELIGNFKSDSTALIRKIGNPS